MFSEHSDDVFDLGAGDALVAEQLVDGDAAGDGGLPVNGFDGVFQYFSQQAGPVLQASAVLIRPIVVAPRQEVVQAAEAVAGVDVDDVEVDRQRPADRLEVPVPHVRDVGLGHRAGLHRIVVPRHDRQMLWRQRGFTTYQVGAVEAVVRELDAGKGAALVDLLRDLGERGHVMVVPQPQLDERTDV